MKTNILLATLMCMATPAIAGILPADQAKLVADNIGEHSGDHFEQYDRVRTLCLNALNDGIADDERVFLTRFAGGDETITSSREESYWRIAANFAVFNVDGDIDRLYNLASGNHLDAAIASLNVLRTLEPDPAIGDFFIKLFFDDWDRNTDKQKNDRRGEWCSLVAEGLIRHAGHKLATDIVPFIDKRVLDTTMMVSLFFAAIEWASVNEGAETIAKTVFSRTMEPFYLSDMASAMRSINQEQVVLQKADELRKAAEALMPAQKTHH